jgi:hypothetical protein
LLETVEEPEFLADPSHRKRIFARAIYNLSSAPVKTSRVTKGLAGHLKYCYGACVKRNRHLKAEELSEKVANFLEHVCNNHVSCDAAWCYNVKPKEAGKVYSAPKDHRINKEIDKLTHLQLKKYLINTLVLIKCGIVITHLTHKLMRVLTNRLPD